MAALIDDGELGRFLHDLTVYPHPSAGVALLQAIYHTAQRSGEVRRMKWSELDMTDGAETWTSDVTKTGLDRHLVPLSRQMLDLIERQRQTPARNTPYVFAGPGPKGILSDAAPGDMIEKLGWRGKVTAHGARASFRTIMAETKGFDVGVIEQQIAHRVVDPLGRSYNRAQNLPERRRLMQAWSDHLDFVRGQAAAKIEASA